MLRKLLTAAALAGTAAAGIAAAAPAAAAQRGTPEEQLQRAIAGRVAGDPVDCINLRSIRGQRVIEGTAIIYEMGDTIYVNRPRSGAQSLTRWDTQVVRPFSNRLCSIDTVNVLDPSTRMFRGTVFLGEFVPYRRVRAN